MYRAGGGQGRRQLRNDGRSLLLASSLPLTSPATASLADRPPQITQTMAAPDDLLPVLGIPAAHLVPLGVLAVYLAVVVLLLKRALDAVTAAAPPPCTSSSSPSSHDKDDARRNDRWRWVFTAIAAGSLLHTWTRASRHLGALPLLVPTARARQLPADAILPCARTRHAPVHGLELPELFPRPSPGRPDPGGPARRRRVAARDVAVRGGVGHRASAGRVGLDLGCVCARRPPSDLVVAAPTADQTDVGAPPPLAEHITHYTITFWVLLLWVYTRPEGGAVGWRAQSWGRPAAALFLALGQLVAISVASALFFAGCARRGLGRAAVDRVRVPVGVWAPLLVSSTLSALVPLTTDRTSCAQPPRPPVASRC